MVIQHVNRIFDDEMEQQREWKKMANSLGIPIVESPHLAKARHARAMAQVEADFLG